MMSLLSQTISPFSTSRTPFKAKPTMFSAALTVALLLMVSGSLHAQDRKILRKVAPVYPALAKQMHINGEVRVVATVDASGSVVKAESDSLKKLLVPAALDAVKQWKFAPADGVSTLTIDVSFSAS